MRILAIDHVQLTVEPSEVSSAHHFYTQTLGLEEIDKPDSLKARGGFWLIIGDRQVHVGVETGVDRRATKAHFAFQVDDLKEWRKNLQEAGCELAESVPIPGIDRFEFRDPFGNRLEMLTKI